MSQTDKTSLSYRDAGVDIDAGDQLVENIKPFARKTMRPEVLGGIGGFGALFEISKKYRNPVLVSGTDGVGTKLKLAFQLNRHNTVGIDLVAMSVNDILVQGAEPLFFLDYFACGKLDVTTATDVVKGIAKGCELAGCALIGGETAEMPGMYPEGEYDLAGFAVGVVEKTASLTGAIREGDGVGARPVSPLQRLFPDPQDHRERPRRSVGGFPRPAFERRDPGAHPHLREAAACPHARASAEGPGPHHRRGVTGKHSPHPFARLDRGDRQRKLGNAAVVPLAAGPGECGGSRDAPRVQLRNRMVVVAAEHTKPPWISLRPARKPSDQRHRKARSGRTGVSYRCTGQDFRMT